MLGPSQTLRQAGVRTLAALVVAGCGSTAVPPTTVGNQARVVLRAPSCVHDPKWTVEIKTSEIAMLVAIGGVAAITALDDYQPAIDIEALDTRKVLAHVTLPVPEDAFVFPERFVTTSSGTVLLASSAINSDGYTSAKTTNWLVRFDAAGTSTPARVQLPEKETVDSDLIAVGDQLVIFSKTGNSEEGVEAVVAMVDETGKVLHQLDEPSAIRIFPIGPTTFAVQAEIQNDTTVLRVFDTKLRDWVAPAITLDRALHDTISLGGRAILVGYSENYDDNEIGIATTFLAAIDATGALTPWKPLGFDAYDARFTASPDGSAAYLLARRDMDIHLFAVGPDLRVRAAKPPLPAPATGLGITPLALGDSLYIADLQTIERYDCK